MLLTISFTLHTVGYKLENDRCVYWTSEHRNIGTLWQHRWIGVSGLPILIQRKNYGLHCSELSPHATAKIFSLTGPADEQHLSLLALINVPSPPPTMSTRSRQLAVAIYCMGGHTDVKATEAGTVGSFRFHKCPQEMHGWRMLPLADADPAFKKA